MHQLAGHEHQQTKSKKLFHIYLTAFNHYEIALPFRPINFSTYQLNYNVFVKFQVAVSNQYRFNTKRLDSYTLLPDTFRL